MKKDLPQAVFAVFKVLLLFGLEAVKVLHKLVYGVPLVVKIIHWKIFFFVNGIWFFLSQIRNCCQIRL
jgi:hypothetical protein